jgi:hypothetical protein
MCWIVVENKTLFQKCWLPTFYSFFYKLQPQLNEWYFAKVSNRMKLLFCLCCYNMKRFWFLKHSHSFYNPKDQFQNPIILNKLFY